MMQERGEFAGNSDDGTLFCVLASTRGEFEAPASQIGIGPERPEDVLSCLYQEPSQERVSRAGDAKLWVVVSRLSPLGCEAEIGSHASSSGESTWIFQDEDVCQRGQSSNA